MGHAQERKHGRAAGHAAQCRDRNAACAFEGSSGMQVARRPTQRRIRPHRRERKKRRRHRCQNTAARSCYAQTRRRQRGVGRVSSERKAQRRVARPIERSRRRRELTRAPAADGSPETSLSLTQNMLSAHGHHRREQYTRCMRRPGCVKTLNPVLRRQPASCKPRPDACCADLVCVRPELSLPNAARPVQKLSQKLTKFHYPPPSQTRCRALR